jgi:hypothetical protein
MQFASTIGALAVISFASAQTPPAPAPDQPLGPSGRIQARFSPPPRINKFTAEPSSLQPGQSCLLIWATENPAGITITPDIGAVAARGTRKLTPRATTTYTITVHGAKDALVTKTITVTVAGTVPITAESTAETKKEVPRTADGKPDLSGVYNFASRATDAPPELKPGAEKYKVVRGPTDAGVYADCMPTGVPLAYFVPYQWQIVQGRDKVAILYEYLHMFRTVPIGGVHPVDPDPTWMGDSVGHWEGDTLVVDTIAFNDRATRRFPPHRGAARCGTVPSHRLRSSAVGCHHRRSERFHQTLDPEPHLSAARRPGQGGRVRLREQSEL